jgi:hypothetical protein
MKARVTIPIALSIVFDLSIEETWDVPVHSDKQHQTGKRFGRTSERSILGEGEQERQEQSCADDLESVGREPTRVLERPSESDRASGENETVRSHEVIL